MVKNIYFNTMIKFSKKFESVNNETTYKISCVVDIVVKANSEGEASYIADETLSSIKNQSNYNIIEITPTSEEDLNPLSECKIVRK